jgi:hypothetical protein
MSLLVNILKYLVITSHTKVFYVSYIIMSDIIFAFHFYLNYLRKRSIVHRSYIPQFLSDLSSERISQRDSTKFAIPMREVF